ncbi:MAG: DUF2752 domain-containing protein [Muribaculaceae bacterium]|nr:DUF2752 domain-containing protein [Muribaculaceae bacterium]
MSWRRAIVITLIMVIAVVAVTIYFFWNPATHGFFPRCVFLNLTGLKCPGCGSQRAIHALLHGEVAAALRFNAFLLIGLPLLCVYAVAEWQRTRWPRFYVVMSSRPVLCVIVLMVLLWWVLRNLFGC